MPTCEQDAPDSLPLVVILAGGFGTRVRHLLPGVPKPMAAVAGRPFVEWVVRFFARHGAKEFAIATGHLAEVVARHFGRHPVPGTRVVCTPESRPLGTAGGCLNCLTAAQAAAETCLVTNGDSLALADPAPLAARVRGGRSDAAILGVAVADAARYGTLEADDHGRLTAFREKRAGAGLINAGVYGFNRAAWSTLPENRPLSFESDVFPALVARRRVEVVPTAAPFLDIGTPAGLAEAQNFIANNQNAFLP